MDIRQLRVDFKASKGLQVTPNLYGPVSAGKPHSSFSRAVNQQQRPHLSAAGADGRSEDLLETTWPPSDLTARPCLASAASERHFSPGSPEETPLHKMLFLPAAALCCLCSALVAMAAELRQDDLTLTRRVGQQVSFSCGGTDQCDVDNYVLWYQKKDTETFTIILVIDRSDGKVYGGYGHPQVNDFSAVNKQNSCELQIKDVKLVHSATYYCSCYKRDPHSEKCSLQPVQKPPDEQMSNSVCDRKRAVNHSPGSHISPPSQPESQTY